MLLKQYSLTVGTENGSGGSLKRHHSLPTQLSYDVVNECYTKGIDVQQVNLSGNFMSSYGYNGTRFT